MNEELIFVQDYAGIPGVKEIVLNRPSRKNALNLAMWKQFAEAVDECDSNRLIRMIVVRGVDETAFAAGADISEFPEHRSNRELFMEYQRMTDFATRVLRVARPITIASIRGVCYGGGMQIASACDIRVSDDSARFAITPGKLGFVYGVYETGLLMNIVGEAKTKDLLISARELKAHEANAVGFTSQCFRADEFETEFRRYLLQLAEVSPTAQQGIKKIIHSVSSGQLEENDDTQELILTSIEGADYQEGIQAFLEKRKPKFSLENTIHM